MKEIKFRAWDDAMSNTFKLSDLHVTFDDSKSYYRIIDGIDSWKIMQYTGLKDKNGKEIYEGDVLGGNRDFVEYIGGNVDALLVGFDNGCFMAGRYKDQPKTMNTYLWLIAKETEVIGNIYENPELLNA